MNGHLKKHCHGTRNVLPQLVQNVRVHQTILDEEYRKNRHDGEIRGKVKLKQLTSECLKALQEGNFPISDKFFLVFPRYKLNGVTWKNSDQLRNSSACKFTTSSGIKYVSICCFCICNKNPTAIIAIFNSMRSC